MLQPGTTLTLERCTRCQEWKTVDSFYKDRSRGDGLNARCKTCQDVVVARTVNPVTQRDVSKKHYQRTKHKRRDEFLQQTYGITLEQYNDLFASQNLRCAICKTATSSSHWCTDHCHTTGVVRGILCHNCNTLLGHAKDNVGTLQAAIDYLIINTYS